MKPGAGDQTGSLRNIEIHVDGNPIVDFNHYVVDISELARSVYFEGTHYFLNCSCGILECGRVEGGTLVWRDDDGEPIHWEMDGPATTKGFVFGYCQYVK
ncbi:hypothetical protein EHM92_00670, partial [bacterium]